MSGPFPKRLVDTLARKQAGIHALVSHAGAVPARPEEDFVELLSGDKRFAEDTVIELRATEHALSAVRARKAGADVEVASELSADADLRQLFGAEHGSVAVLAGIAELPLETQLDWLGRFRALHGTRRDVRLVVTGPWATNAFIAAWKEHRSHLSPALNRTNVSILGGHTLEGVRELVAPFLKGSSAARHALCELAWEHTQGDRFLVEHLLEDLEHLGEPSLVDAESAILKLAEHSHVSDRILESLNALDAHPRARQKLAACLHVGAIRLDEADLDAEQLMLHGLLRNVRREEHSHWQITSQVVRSALRKYPERLELTRRDLGADDEMFPTCNPVGAHASRLVAEIEWMLRNFIITRLSRADAEHPLHVVPRRGDEDLYQIASSRRDADRDSSHVTLVAQPLSGHLDVGDLHAIIANTELYPTYFAAAFRDKSQFTASFTEFNTLRQAVAHNKLASVTILPKLERLRDHFEGELARMAEAEVKHVPPERLIRVNMESVRTFHSPQGGCSIEVEIENISGSALHAVKAVASFTVDGDASLREAHCEPQSLHRDEKRRVKLSAKGAGAPAVKDVRVTSARRRL